MASGPGDESSEDQEFDYAEENTSTNLEGMLDETTKALELFADNEIDSAKALLASCRETSMYHALGYGTILFIEAMMTFDRDDLAEASKALKHSADICSRNRKKIGIAKAIISGPQMSGMTDLELHAEICHAESLLLKALAAIVVDDSLVTFVKGGMKIRQSYQTYKACYNYVTRAGYKLQKVPDPVRESQKRKSRATEWPIERKTEAGTFGTGQVKEKKARKPSKLLTAFHRLDSSKPESKVAAQEKCAVFRQEFIAGVYLGYGVFNVLFSLLPANALKLLEFAGVSGDQELGLNLLCQVSVSCTLRMQIGCLALTTYYYYIVPTLDLLPKSDSGVADGIVNMNQILFPESAVCEVFRGRRCLLSGEPEKAIACYEKSMASRGQLRQLDLVCYWELLCASASQLMWLDAAKFADALVQHSGWSRAVCLYFNGIFLYMDRLEKGAEHNPETKAELSPMFAKVATYKKVVAGKSLPAEKFVIRKCRKYEMQGKYLLLPALEAMYLYAMLEFVSAQNLHILVATCLDAMIGIQAECDKLEEAQRRHGEDKERVKAKANETDQVGVDGRETAKDQGSEREVVGQCTEPAHAYPFDDLCLTYLLRGFLEKLLGNTAQAEADYKHVLAIEPSVKLDHWMVPYARVELATVYIETGRLKMAKEQLLLAANRYKGYSMESRLRYGIDSHLRMVQQLLDDCPEPAISVT